MNILWIDAWGNKNEGYEWNDWHTVHVIEDRDLIFKILDNRDSCNDVFNYLINEELISSANGLHLVDDGYNILVKDEEDVPIYAIEYGALI